jgi:hypothetical protein
VALADFLEPGFRNFRETDARALGRARRLLVASPAPSGEDRPRRLVLPLSGIGVRGRHCQKSQLSGTCRKRDMAFEVPHFGREQSEADGATPVGPVDAVDQQREPLVALGKTSRGPRTASRIKDVMLD